MTNFNAERYVHKIAKDFYTALNLEPMEDAVLTASNVAHKRDAIYNWYTSLKQDLVKIAASNLKDLYETLVSKTSSGEIGLMHIIFSSDDEQEPIQDKHPLLRAVDFAAHNKNSVQAYSYRSVDGMSLEKRSKRFKELGDKYDSSNRKSTPLITHLFLNVENQNIFSIGSKGPTIQEALNKATEYEEDVIKFAIAPQNLAENPDLLKKTF